MSLSLSLSLSVCLSIYLSIYLSICKLLNQRQKRNNSTRRLQFLNLTTSKTKQFCEHFSIFELDNIKSKAILRDFLEKWKVKCSADSLVPMRFAIFPLHLYLKYCACHEKLMPGHAKCCTCHAKSSEQTYRSDAPKCNPSQEISALTS